MKVMAFEMTLLAGYRQTRSLVSTNRGSRGEGQRTHTHTALSVSGCADVPDEVNNALCASGRLSFPSGSALELSVKYAGIRLVEYSCSYFLI